MRTVLDFLSGTKVELAKVAWPTLEQTLKLTLIVIIVTVSVGFFIGLIDYFLAKGLETVINR